MATSIESPYVDMDSEKYRTGLKRVWAAIVDGIVFLPLLLVDQWIFRSTENVPLISGWLIVSAFVPILYSVILHYKYGYTIGKWVARIKVLDISETRTISLKQALLRDGFYLAIEVIGLIYFLFLVRQSSDGSYLYNDYDIFSGNVLFYWTLAELTTMLTNRKRRALHDFIAKTIVVRE